jgi:hypothetical protein
MSPAMTGAWVGAALGLASFAGLRWIAARVEQGNPDPQQRQSAGLIRIAALADLMVFPIVGYVLGPMVLD